MANGIQIGSINRVNQREGYSDTINPSSFVNSFNGMIQAGQQVQNLAGQASDFFAKQTAIENDNYVNNQLLDFEKEKTKVLNYLTLDPKAKKISPSGYSQYVTEKLTTFRSKQLAKIPHRRLEQYKLATEQSLMTAQASAMKHTKKINDDDFDLTTRQMSRQILESAANPNTAWDKQTQLNGYTSRVANGVVANVYSEVEGLKKLAKFKEDLADTVWNRRESEALKNKETTLTEIVALGEAMSKDPDLDPEMKFKRAESLLTRFNTQQTRARKDKEDIADEKEFKVIAGLYEKMRTPRSDRVSPNDPTITHEDIATAIKGGLRNKTVLKQMYDIANDQEDLRHLGDEDNEPDLGYIDDIKKLEYKALSAGLTDKQLDQQLSAVVDKARLDTTMTSKELTRIDGARVTVYKNFKDEGKSNFATQKTQARQAIRKLYGGGDQFKKQFNMIREDLIADVYNTARILIKGGMDWAEAVERVRPLVTEVKAVGIQRFKGVTAKDLVIKARNGKLDDSDRFVLDAMASRRQARDDKRDKQVDIDNKPIPNKVARDKGIK